MDYNDKIRLNRWLASIRGELDEKVENILKIIEPPEEKEAWYKRRKQSIVLLLILVILGVLIAVAHGTYTASKQSDFGLKWHKWDKGATNKNRPDGTQLLNADDLVVILRERTELTLKEWMDMNISGLTTRHYVEVDGEFFQPTAVIHDFWGIKAVLAERKTRINLTVTFLLGFVFGFLDNFGLFMGMSVFDPSFYMIATNTMAHTTKDIQKLHELSDGMMQGLGNTFSDLVGILAGQAIFAGAIATFRVDAGTFWVMDIISMLFGCLLGAFLPALATRAPPWGPSQKASIIALLALAVILGLVMAPKQDDTFKDVVVGAIIIYISFVVLWIIGSRMSGLVKNPTLDKWEPKPDDVKDIEESMKALSTKINAIYPQSSKETEESNEPRPKPIGGRWNRNWGTRSSSNA